MMPSYYDLIGLPSIDPELAERCYDPNKVVVKIDPENPPQWISAEAEEMEKWL